MRRSIGLKSALMGILLVSALSFGGCFVRIGGSRPPRPRPHPSPPAPLCPDHSDSNFEARLAAAHAMSSFTSRDRALSVIAVDAACASDIQHTLKALSAMSSFTRRDSTSEKCADIFLERYMIEEASQVAGQVSSFTTRDRILSNIAQTPAPPPVEENL